MKLKSPSFATIITIITTAILLPLPTHAKIGLDGCQPVRLPNRNDVIFIIPTTGEVCTFLQCAPVAVPGCAAYTGTEPYVASFISPIPTVPTDLGALETESPSGDGPVAPVIPPLNAVPAIPTQIAFPQVPVDPRGTGTDSVGGVAAAATTTMSTTRTTSGMGVLTTGTLSTGTAAMASVVPGGAAGGAAGSKVVEMVVVCGGLLGLFML